MGIKNNQPKMNKTQSPRHNDVVSQPQASEVKYKKLYARMYESVINRFAFDSKFNERSDEDLHSITKNMIKDMEFQNEQVKLLKMERNAKNMRVTLKRQQERIFSDFSVDFDEKESHLRTRHRTKFSEYELNRYELLLSKSRHRLMKKAHKMKRRLDLIEFYHSNNFEMESLELEYNSSDVSELLNFSYFAELTEKIKEIYGSMDFTGDASILISMVNFILVLIRTKDRILRSSAAITVAASLKCDTRVKCVSAILAVGVGFVGNVFQDTNEEKLVYNSLETMSELGSLLDKILNAEFASAIRQMFIGLTTYLAFPREIAGKVFDVIGTTGVKMSGLRLVKTILDIIVKVGRSASLWWNGSDGEAVPLSEILFGASTMDGIRERYQLLDLYKDSTYAGLPVERHMCQFHYMRLAKEFLSTIKSYCSCIGRHSPDYRKIQEMGNLVTKWSMVIGNRIASASRIPAFALMIVGDPGTGKSLTTQLLLSRPAAIKGYKYDPNQVYFKNPSDEWWEGYKPQEHNIVFMSEVGKKSRALAKTQGDDALDVFLSACDTNPYSVKMAFEGKGVIQFLAELFVIDTNNMDLNLDVLYSNAGAFWRRILIVEQLLLPEYKMVGSCEVNKRKVLDDIKSGVLENFFDAFRYNISKNIPETAQKVKENFIARDIGYRELVDTFDTLFIQHQAHNSAVNAQILDIVRSIGCKTPYDHPVNPLFEEPVDPEMKLKTQGVHGANVAQSLGLPAKVRFYNMVNDIKEFVKVKRKLGCNSINGPSMLFRIKESLFDEDKMELKIIDTGIVNHQAYAESVFAAPYDVTSESSQIAGSDIAPVNNYFVKRRDFITTIERLMSNEIKVLKISDDYTSNDKMLHDLHYIRSNMHPSALVSDLWFGEANAHISKYRDTTYSNISVSKALKDIYYRLNSFESEVESKCEFQDADNEKDQRTYFQFSYDYLVDFITTFFSIPVLYFLTLVCGSTKYSDILKTCLPVVFLTYIGFLPHYISIIMVLFMTFMCYIPRLLQWCLRKQFSNRLRFQQVRCYNIGARFINHVGFKCTVMDIDTILCMRNAQYAVFAGCAVYGSSKIFSLISSILQKRREVVGYNAAFSKFDKGDVDYEDLAGCREPYKRIKCVQDPHNWNICQNLVEKMPFVGSEENFRNFIAKNTYKVFYHTKSSVFDSHCYGLKGNIVLINTHFHFKARNGGKIFISLDGSEDSKYGEVSVDPKGFVDLGDDQTLALCTMKFKDSTKHILNGPVFNSVSVIGGVTVGAIYADNNNLIVEGTKFGPHYRYTGYSGKGLCGNLLTTKVGSSWSITGMHIVGSVDESIGFAIELNRDRINRGIEKLHELSSLMPLHVIPNSNALLRRLPEPKVNAKSPFSHIHLPNIDFFGQIACAKVNRGSRVKLNVFNEIIHDIEKVTGIPRVKEFSKPLLKPMVVDGKYVSPQNNALKFFTKAVEINEVNTVKRAVDYLVPKLLERIKNDVGDIKLSPYKSENAINGSPDDAFLRRINASTAAGFEMPGKKSKYIPLNGESEIRIPDEKTCERMREILKSYDDGELSTSIFNVSLKDEPVSKKKAAEGATRLFYVHELPHLIISRMFIGPIVTLIQQTDAFCSMVGINMYMEADKVHKILTKFNNYMEADARKFDITAALLPRWGTFTIVYELARALGYNEYALKYLTGVLSDLLHPYYLLDGDLYSKSSVPSGHYGTAELNCLIVLIMMVIAFLEGKDRGDIPENEDFFDNVSPAYYGDDQSASVSDLAASSVNNKILYDIYDRMNMELTASDKCSELTEFVDIKDATFLKRTFEYSRTFGRIMAPLDPNSIYKMSSISVESDNCSPQEQSLSIANSALSEWFIHVTLHDDGMVKYNELRSLYRDRLNKVFGDSVQSERLFSYEKCLDLYVRKDIVA